MEKAQIETCESMIKYFKKNPDRMNSNICYYKLWEKSNSIENHNELIEKITLERWRLEDEADIKLDALKMTKYPVTKEKLKQEALKTRDNSYFLTAYDTKLDEILSKYRSEYFIKVLKN